MKSIRIGNYLLFSAWVDDDPMWDIWIGEVGGGLYIALGRLTLAFGGIYRDLEEP